MYEELKAGTVVSVRSKAKEAASIIYQVVNADADFDFVNLYEEARQAFPEFVGEEPLLDGEKE